MTPFKRKLLKRPEPTDFPSSPVHFGRPEAWNPYLDVSRAAGPRSRGARKKRGWQHTPSSRHILSLDPCRDYLSMLGLLHGLADGENTLAYRLLGLYAVAHPSFNDF